MLISALEHGDRIAVLERDHGLLPPSRRPAGAATGDRVPAHLHRAYARSRDPEQLLQRVPDLVLVGLGVHLEGVHLARLVGARALLGHHRADDDLVQRGHYLLPFFFGLPFGADLAGFRAAFFAALAVLFLAALALVADFLAALASVFLAVLAAFRLLAAFDSSEAAAFLSALSVSPVSSVSSSSATGSA